MSRTLTNDLNAFDQDRVASMADEGGASGALMEHQHTISQPASLERGFSNFSGVVTWRRASLAALGVIAGIAAFRIIKGRSTSKHSPKNSGAKAPVTSKAA